MIKIVALVSSLVLASTVYTHSLSPRQPYYPITSPCDNATNPSKPIPVTDPNGYPFTIYCNTWWSDSTNDIPGNYIKFVPWEGGPGFDVVHTCLKACSDYDKALKGKEPYCHSVGIVKAGEGSGCYLKSLVVGKSSVNLTMAEPQDFAVGRFHEWS